MVTRLFLAAVLCLFSIVFPVNAVELPDEQDPPAEVVDDADVPEIDLDSSAVSADEALEVRKESSEPQELKVSSAPDRTSTDVGWDAAEETAQFVGDGVSAARYGAQAGAGWGLDFLTFGQIDGWQDVHDTRHGDKNRLVSVNGLMNFATVVDAVMDSDNPVSSAVESSREELSSLAAKSYRLGEAVDPTETKTVTATSAGAGYTFALLSPGMAELTVLRGPSLVGEALSGLPAASRPGLSLALADGTSAPIPVSAAVGEQSVSTGLQLVSGSVLPTSYEMSSSLSAKGRYTGSVRDEHGNVSSFSGGKKVSETRANGDRYRYLSDGVLRQRANGSLERYLSVEDLPGGGKKLVDMDGTIYIERADGSVETRIGTNGSIDKYDQLGRSISREVGSVRVERTWLKTKIRGEDGWRDVTFRDGRPVKAELSDGTVSYLDEKGRVVYTVGPDGTLLKPPKPR